MREIPLTPLTEAAFAPFGTLVEYSAEENRRRLVKELQNTRAEQGPQLDFATVFPRALPISATKMERHRHSSQSFIPVDVARYLVVVAPDADGAPDLARARAFAASGRQSITYRAGVWHHPLTPLDRTGSFAILTFRAGDAGDEEWGTLPEPLRLGAPG
ncbi:MAG: ureidoglycolate lyase [Alphaproteobacteria bacterium]|nr:ureidoglycolate lyase [Alphaproteobacteria bacterium]